MPVVKPPFVTDADTVLAYRMNETAGQGWSTSNLSDEKAAFPMTSVSQEVLIRNFNGVVGRRCRKFPGGSIGATRANSAAATTVWQGQWTIECFVVLDSVAAEQCIISYGAVGETEATNLQGRLNIAAGGAMVAFWEYGAGSNAVFTSTLAILSVGVPYHLACRKRLDTGVYYVDFFINGVLIETISNANNATGGTSATWGIGRDAATPAGAGLTGSMRSLHLSNVARSDAEILANSALATQMHVVDGSSAAHWKMDELPGLVDDGPHGLHMREVLSTTTRVTAIVNDAGGATGARLFGASVYFYTVTPEAAVAALLLGELTVRFAVYIPTANATRRGISCWGEAGFETDATRNYLWYAELSATRNMGFGWEYAAGSGVSVSGAMPYHGGLYIVHLVRRIDPDNVGKFIGEIWVDGDLIASTPNLTGPSGGTNSIPLVGEFNSSNANTLVLDDMHVQKRALTEAEIKTDAGVTAEPKWTLESAAAVSSTVVRVASDEALLAASAADLDDALNKSNWAIYKDGIAQAISSVSAFSATEYDITMAQEMVDGETYTLHALGARTADGATVDREDDVDRIDFTGEGTIPDISAVSVGDRRLDVTFTEDLDRSTVQYTDFTITSLGSGVAVVPTSIAFSADNALRITLDKRMTNGESYRLSVNTSVADKVGNPVAGGTQEDFVGFASPVEISAIVPLSSTSVRVTFDSDIDDDSDTLDESNYNWDNGLRTLLATYEGLRTVILTTTEMQRGVKYTLTVG